MSRSSMSQPFMNCFTFPLTNLAPSDSASVCKHHPRRRRQEPLPAAIPTGCAEWPERVTMKGPPPLRAEVSPVSAAPVRSGLLKEQEPDALASGGLDLVGIGLTRRHDTGGARPKADGPVSVPEPQGGLTGDHVEEVPLRAPVVPAVVAFRNLAQPHFLPFAPAFLLAVARRFALGLLPRDTLPIDYDVHDPL